MISLGYQLCEELDFTYWELKSEKVEEIHAITHEEKELLRKILIAKAVTLEDDILELQPCGVAVISLSTYQLIFNDVSLVDTGTTVNLAKLSDMLKDKQLKKLTWYKLKGLTF